MPANPDPPREMAVKSEREIDVKALGWKYSSFILWACYYGKGRYGSFRLRMNVVGVQVKKNCEIP